MGVQHCFVQIDSASLAHRLVLLHQNPTTRHNVFGEALATEALHLAAGSDGRHLVKFASIGIPPLQWVQWLSSSCLRASINRVFFVGEPTATNLEVTVEIRTSPRQPASPVAF